MPVDDAATVGALMAEADLQGSDGHGVIRVAPYVRRIKAGGINLRPRIRVVEERAATALIDGDNGMGHLVMSRAAELAAQKARVAGIGWVGSRLSNHAGPASLYARLALPHEMIGLYFAVGNANHLPPWGGLEMLLSTNPIAVAVPTGDEAPIVLDMATTVAANGKVKAKAQRGEAMPEGWTVDRQGRPRPEARRRRVLAADRWLQGLWPVAHRRPARRHAQRRRDEPRRDRLEPRRQDHHQHRPGDRDDRSGGLGGVAAFKRRVDVIVPDLLLAAAALLPGAAAAQGGYPNKPIRMIVPLAAGSAVDVAARIVAQKMSGTLGP